MKYMSGNLTASRPQRAAPVELGGGLQPLPDLFLLFLRFLSFLDLGRADHGRGTGDFGATTGEPQNQRQHSQSPHRPPHPVSVFLPALSIGGPGPP